MTQRRAGLGMLVAGDVLLFLALFSQGALVRRATLYLAAGLLLGGLALFLPTLRTARRAWPPAVAVALAALGVALHVYENARLVSGGFSLGWLLWGLAPYALCLVASAFVATRRPATVGAAVALGFDLWIHHVVFTAPMDFGSAFLLIFRPLVSGLALVPAAGGVAWLVGRRGPGPGDAAAP